MAQINVMKPRLLSFILIVFNNFDENIIIIALYC